MRIAFCLFKYFPYGGLQRDFCGIALACLNAGYQIDVFTLEWHGQIIPAFNLNILPKRGISNHQVYRNFSDDVSQHLERQDYQAVIGFNKMPYLDIYYAADSCYYHYLTSQRPYWYRFLPRSVSLLASEREIFSAHQTTQILAIAKDQVQEYQASYATPDSRFELLPPWIKSNRFYTVEKKRESQHIRQQFKIAKDDWLILAVGSGFRSKGLDRSLDALASLPTSILKKTHFIIIGEDKFNVYQRQIKKLHLMANVHYLGGRNDVPDFLFAADLLLHPARNESAGIVLLEAIVAGLPVLTTKSCGYADYVSKSNAGVVLDLPFSQYILNQTLLKMLRGLSHQAWSKNGIQFGLKNHFDQMPDIARQHIESYIHNYQVKQTRNYFVWQSRTLSPCIHHNDPFQMVETIQGEIFRQVKHRKTLRFISNGEAFFLKIHHGIGLRECLKAVIQAQLPVIGAKTEFQVLCHLVRHQVPTLQIVASGWRGKNPLKQQSFLMTQELAGVDSLENILAKWEQQKPKIHHQYQLIKAIAQLTKRIHEIGVNHRDYYSCHLLANMKPGACEIDFENLKIYVLDLHRAQLRQKVPHRWLIKDLGSLLFSLLNTVLTKKHWLYFIKHYEDRPLRKIFIDHTKLWDQVAKRADKLQKKAIRKKITIAGKPYERRVLV